jgi:hypothetical protein
VPDVDDAGRLRRFRRFAQRRAADAAMVGDLGFGRRRIARLAAALDDEALVPVLNREMERLPPERPRFRRRLLPQRVLARKRSDVR